MPVILLINNLEHIAELKFGSQELSQVLPPQQPYSPHKNLASSAIPIFLPRPVSHCSVRKHQPYAPSLCPPFPLPFPLASLSQMLPSVHSAHPLSDLLIG